MKHWYPIAALPILGFLSGCSSAVLEDDSRVPGASPSAAPEVDVGAPAAKSEAGQDGQSIEAAVSGIFPVADAAYCVPYGVPITTFLTGAFDQNALVNEMVVPEPNGRCRHDQVLSAPADAWATLAYAGICRGGGDPHDCGAIDARRCSVDLLRRWSEERVEAVSSREPTFGFTITVPPLDDGARTELSNRADEEEATLVGETIAAKTLRAARSRNCPGEEL